MASSSADDPRIAKLSSFFNKVIYGERTLSTARDGKLFIEAICVQADPATCAHKLTTKPYGLPSLQASVRFDTSISFINESTATLLQYLQSPSLKAINSGSVLAQLLLSIVEPPFFWEALTKSFIGGLLDSNASRGFAWLLLELISFPGKASTPYLALASSSNVLGLILKSPDGETRILGQKIKSTLSLNVSEIHCDTEAKPGGRHDNDHVNYREITIMPTPDELLSRDRPFFRTADFFNDPEVVVLSRSTLYLDNQFRLLREDMLGEIREELKILTGAKIGRHKGIVVDNLSLAGVELGTDRKRIPWGIVLACKDDLPQLKNIKPDKRKDHLKINRHILRQGNMACLLIDNEPAAFPTIYRDEELLIRTPAAIIIQFADDPTFSYSLSKMKTATNIKLVQLDSSIFAFEPFLRRLQEINDLPLKHELLYWDTGKEVAGPSFQLGQVIDDIKLGSGEDLKDVLRIKKSVVLDDSQTKSLHTCLRQSVSLVQGPPGES